MGELYSLNNEAPLPYSLGPIQMQKSQYGHFDKQQSTPGYAAIAHILGGAAANTDVEYGRLDTFTAQKDDPMKRLDRKHIDSLFLHDSSTLPASVMKAIPKNVNYGCK